LSQAVDNNLNTKASSGIIHYLVEHQSTPEKHMDFRLIRYAIAATQRHLQAGHKTLPLVVAVLFYAGICTIRRDTFSKRLPKYILRSLHGRACR